MKKDNIKLYLLENQFYIDYQGCSEILNKENRPYVVFLLTLNNLTFAVPLRSNISHKYAIKTVGNKGIDFSKAVVINDRQKYISNKRVLIGSREYQIIMSQKWSITQKMANYIEKYKKALKNNSVPANKNLCNSSSLQYFHAELGIK
ncbi:type III toxin-antitoxin system TenpIN family toxin [Leptotrichia sp. oral taxon 879]|uniref:type III toxin-antitoxin system TenpIN family toxin n=1 Tax=Leptotrichia sp. oral taxon 879 TaxID=1227267 RepID=UPI0003AE6647|nr:hypothetical protein [Leptotrichia sp. oral taxon 879]ERK50264.1 hypothetical protein HMPREF1552_01455 [Leptotrichia sp. oral taxon 879 str. F0557]